VSIRDIAEFGIANIDNYPKMLKFLSVAALAAMAYAQGPATPELAAEDGDLVFRLPRDGEGRFVRQQTVNLG